MSNTIITETIERVYREKHNEMKQHLDDFYHDLASMLNNSPSEEWKSVISTEEEQNLSMYIHDYYYQYKSAVIDACSELIPKSTATICWMSATNGIQLPEIVIISVVDNEPAAPAFSAETAPQPSSSDSRPPVGRWLIIGGVCHAILGWVLLSFLLPGKPVWGAIVEGIGLVVITAGIMVLWNEKKSLVQANRDVERTQEEEARRAAHQALIDLCCSQRDANLRCFEAWMNEIRDRIVPEYEKAFDEGQWRKSE